MSESGDSDAAQALPAATTAPLAEQVRRVLPQTQCTRCGYPDCSAYAQAVAAGECAINRCLPGGDYTIERLAAITAQAPLALDPEVGEPGPRTLAFIDSEWCIGCMLCIKACPVDAIIGAPKHMHVVIADGCTGCELCVPPCPVDCIDLRPDAGGPRDAAQWLEQRAGEALQRYQRRTARETRARTKRRTKLLPTLDERRREVAAAVARAKRKQRFKIEIR